MKENDKDEEALGAFVEKQTEPLGDDPYGDAKEQTERKKRVGRPAMEFTERDIQIVVRMASRMCTDKEIAGVLGIGETTLQRHLGAEMKLARAGALESLRASQFRSAHRLDGAMLKWLGIQHLGQADKIITENTNIDFVIDDNDGKESKEPPLEPDANDN